MSYHLGIPLIVLAEPGGLYGTYHLLGEPDSQPLNFHRVLHILIEFETKKVPWNELQEHGLLTDCALTLPQCRCGGVAGLFGSESFSPFSRFPRHPGPPAEKVWKNTPQIYHPNTVHLTSGGMRYLDV